MANPVRQRGSIQIDALSGVDLGLAIQRQVVGIFGHQNLRDGGFGRHAAFDQARRRRGLNDPIFAVPAGIFRAAGDEHPELRRHDVQPLALVLADPVQLALAAAGTGLVVDVDDNLDPRQMRRQRATVGTSLLGPRGSVGRSRLIRCRLIACCCLLDVFEAEQHLIFGQCLGPAAKTVPLQFLDDLAQPLAVTPLGEQHRFQRLEIVGQCVARHDRIRSYSAAFGDALDESYSLRRTDNDQPTGQSARLHRCHRFPRLMDATPVQPFKQRRQLRGR
jgi:hypothetical protein